jgi:sigma-B regulation protein RsbU (phosphoserine phosphatase)
VKRARDQRNHFRRCGEQPVPATRPDLLNELIRRNRVLQSELSDAVAERDELRHAMFDGAQTQRKLCGPRRLRRGSFEFAIEMFPARHLSGDFMSLFDCGSEIAFALGDIIGKGVPAAMWFTHMMVSLRDQVLSHPTPDAAMQALNRDLCNVPFAMPLTTLFLARLNPASGKLLWCNAGHPPAQILSADGRLRPLEDGGPLLGAVAEASFNCGETQLEPGDSLLAYSDGVVECRNTAGIEFGLERLLKAARMSISPAASVVLFSVLAAAQEFTVNQRREDDMAMLVVSRNLSSDLDRK